MVVQMSQDDPAKPGFRQHTHDVAHCARHQHRQLWDKRLGGLGEQLFEVRIVTFTTYHLYLRFFVGEGNLRRASDAARFLRFSLAPSFPPSWPLDSRFQLAGLKSVICDHAPSGVRPAFKATSYGFG